MIEFLWKKIVKRSEKDITTVLKENTLFQDLTYKEIKLVSNIIHVRKYRRDEAVFRQGEIGFGMYIIISGSIDITLEDPSMESFDDDIHETILTNLRNGDFFGELSLIEENGRRTATARANRNTVLIGFFKPNLLEMIERAPKAGVKITMRLSQVLGQRLKDTNESYSLLRDEFDEYKRLERSHDSK